MNSSEKHMPASDAHTFILDNANQMANLGRLFCGEFIRPSIKDNRNPASVAVVLYGLKDSGKTVFSKAALGCFGRAGRRLIGRLSRECTAVEKCRGRTFIHRDFGKFTHYVLSGEYPIDKFSEFNLMQIYNTPLCNEITNGSGFCLFENASVPHFEHSDIVILFSHLGRRDESMNYLSTVSDMTKKYISNNPWKTLLLSRVEVLKKATTDLAEIRQGRVIDVILTSQDINLRKNFQLFRQAAGRLLL